MKSNLAYQSQTFEEEIIQPQPVKRCGTSPGGYPDGEVFLRYRVLSFPRIDLDPPDHGLEICRGMFWGFCIVAATVALILAGIFTLSSIGHRRHAAEVQTHRVADLRSSK